MNTYSTVLFFVIWPRHPLWELNSNLLAKTLDLMTGNNAGGSNIHRRQQQTRESLSPLPAKVPPENTRQQRWLNKKLIAVENSEQSCTLHISIMLLHGQQPCSVCSFCECVCVCEWNAHSCTWTNSELHQLVQKFCVSGAEITHYSLFNKCRSVYQEPGCFSVCRSLRHKLKLITINGVQMLLCARRVKWLSALMQTHIIRRILYL